MLISGQSNGSYVMFYTTIPKAGGPHGKHCIGVAISCESVTGPFIPHDKPLICPPGPRGSGAIGSNYVRDHDGQQYLVFKNGSAFDADQTSHIVLQKLKPNGYEKEDEPLIELLHSTHHSNNDTEGPALVRHPDGKRYVLFWNAGFFAHNDYRIQYAISEGDCISGPYPHRKVLLKSGDHGWGVNLTAPSGLDFVGGSATNIVFMADKETHYGIRQMHTGVLTYRGDDVFVEGVVHSQKISNEIGYQHHSESSSSAG